LVVPISKVTGGIWGGAPTGGASFLENVKERGTTLGLS